MIKLNCEGRLGVFDKFIGKVEIKVRLLVVFIGHGYGHAADDVDPGAEGALLWGFLWVEGELARKLVAR